MPSFDDELRPALDQRQAEQRYRQRFTSSSASSAHTMVDGQSFLAFCSNDYLGLANHPDVVNAMQLAANHYGVGSGASHLVYGHSEHHHKLEHALAEFTGRDRALLFSTGYMANMGVISALTDKGDTIYQDRLNHASLIDAGLLSRAKVKRFRHNDIEQLDRLLATDTSKRKLVVVDGVFSMDGDLAPLPELASLCRKHEARLMIDDAHGFGVLGEQGGGCAEHFQLSNDDLPIIMGTLGKSFGTFGAFVAGSDALIETLIQFARPYIYTTALPPSVAAASMASLSVLRNDSHRRQHLQSLIAYFRTKATELQWPLMESSTPIQPIVLGSDDRVMAAAQSLRNSGILVGAIRPPTVPEGTGRLRLTFNANHSFDDVDRIITALSIALSALPSMTSNVPLQTR